VGKEPSHWADRGCVEDQPQRVGWQERSGWFGAAAGFAASPGRGVVADDRAVGGLFPAIHASRLPIASALREL